jgi:hypothetical protein
MKVSVLLVFAVVAIILVLVLLTRWAIKKFAHKPPKPSGGDQYPADTVHDGEQRKNPIPVEEERGWKEYKQGHFYWVVNGITYYRKEGDSNISWSHGQHIYSQRQDGIFLCYGGKDVWKLHDGSWQRVNEESKAPQTPVQPEPAQPEPEIPHISRVREIEAAALSMVEEEDLWKRIREIEDSNIFSSDSKGLKRDLLLAMCGSERARLERKTAALDNQAFQLRENTLTIAERIAPKETWLVLYRGRLGALREKMDEMLKSGKLVIQDTEFEEITKKPLAFLLGGTEGSGAATITAISNSPKDANAISDAPEGSKEETTDSPDAAKAQL